MPNSPFDEGYIKFQAQHEPKAPFPWAKLVELNHWRTACHAAGLIGVYPDGIGYGNISQRVGESNQFYITGSATGGYETLSAEHYALVTSVDVPANSLVCEGPILASSESMSHAMIYRELPWVTGVIHAHHQAMWSHYLHRVPTTDASAPYGSPEMANSIVDLLRTTELPERKFFVMEGHPEGLFTFGRTLEEAFRVMEEAMAKFATN